MDIGIDHPWASCLMCHDTDQDLLHIVGELRIAGQTPGHHVAMLRQLEMRLFGRQMDFPVAWPADAGTRDKGSGEAVKTIYKQYGLRMMHEHATHSHLQGASATSLEGGIQEVDARERNGKWKVQRSCVYYLEERRTYHRKDGEVVKLKDDTLSAARYGMMMRRHFKPLDECGGAAFGNWNPTSGSGNSGNSRRRGNPVYGPNDWDPFTGEAFQ